MDATARQALEAILFVVDQPVDVSTLSQVLEVGRAEVEAELHALADRLREEGRGFVLREVGGGWRFYTAPDAAPYLERWVLAGRTGRLTQAALETLAVVAYKQPVSRHELSEIRGVNADGALKTLVTRGLVQEVGRDPGPGQAVLYGTTQEFLVRVGINDLEDLPPLVEFLPEGPAPDEPAPNALRAARERLQAGQELVARGRPRWEPGDDPDPAPPDDDPLAEDGAATLPPPAATRAAERELEDLTEALDRVANNALAALDQALRSVEEATGGPGDDDAGAPGTP